MSRALVAASAVVRGAGRYLMTLAVLLLLTFALSSLSPIDPAMQALGDHASDASYAQARTALGLDAPWMVRFGRYVGGVLHGDLGLSRSTGQPVCDDLERAFPATVELATLALIVGGTLGLAMAVLSARHPRGPLDMAARLVSLVGNSIPVFWLGLVALFVFYARLKWAGGTGRFDDAFEYTVDMRTGFALVDGWRSGESGAFQSALHHLVLPVSILGAYAAGQVGRLARTILLGEAGKDYVFLARAKGGTEMRVLLRHMLPNTLGMILTVVALAYANLLEGAVLIETVFARPGLGRYLTTALFSADMPAILGATLVIGACFVAVNAITDDVVRRLDPRIR